MNQQQNLLILASSSPRRKELLAGMGIPFEVEAPFGEEDPYTEEEPSSYAMRSATCKGMDVLSRHEEHCCGRILLAADTIVTFDRHILGKPTSRSDAVSMLEMLSGRTHQVMTGIFLCRVRKPGDWLISGEVVSSDVTFRELGAKEIEDYIDGGEPTDKAGAYAIQGEGGAFVASYQGSYSNIVGLPTERLGTLLKEVFGFDAI